MSTADLVAISGFAAMFLMMLLRVPIGIAMALVGVGGFAAIAGWGPALEPARHLAGAHGDRLQLQPDPDVRPDGRVRDRIRHVEGAVSRRPRLARPVPRRPRARHHRRVRRLRRDLRLVGRDRGDHDQHRAARDAPLRLPRRYGDRRDRGGRHARHPDPALGRARDLRLHDRAGRRPAVHRRHRAGPAGDRHVHGDRAPRLRPHAARGRAGRLAGALGLAARHLGGPPAVHRDHRRHLSRHRDPDRSRRRGRVPHRPDRGRCAAAWARPRSWPAWSRRCAPRSRSSPS